MLGQVAEPKQKRKQTKKLPLVALKRFVEPLSDTGCVVR